ncbi:MAG: 16S rRNA (cytosine(1402)-N(4))-methyltransferase [Candidatus Brennerbacteria bacterium RIFOXYC1_FULL_41_11]|uniref:Ribosomal RNA small subunit methyltransferase H n=1 Tax=Candidatus Brennerbacteria bacterium RIFOXYD1_FULL_41_16 TaxID=1797529 RepID=A0A1G1XMK6_9BACT|nr:MAG: 16S rRNA (cytosine(1402)-N(4))-methyltransferase [Candidatus Brennerbacteria bacterium RIFOXYC1_FULL_41_11]OGY40830.1 MAG: 16S rRNA (cytosine(1402)-N(4))-methyltransferase [Candidatus Brennerbacteria bacterium RIFOXYD1_FULL_41_16]
MFVHVPVLLQEVIEFLNPQSGENFIDATAGEGSYSKEILRLTDPSGKVLAIDWNAEVIPELERNVSSKRLIPVSGNFKNIDEFVEQSGIKEIHGVVYDLGLSKFLLEKSGRGFSFKRDEPLKMSFARESELEADKIINHFSERDLEKIFREYGEERFSKRIAQMIVRSRPIVSSSGLANLIQKTVGTHSKINPATRVFQALRIAVNDELENLKISLPKAIELVASGGRVVVVSYHSLEDGIVKSFFKNSEKNGKVKILTKKPLKPTEQEIKDNPSARSAKLRAIQKI